MCKLQNDSQLKHELLPVYTSMVLIWCVQASERLTTETWAIACLHSWCWFGVCKLHNDSQLKHELLPVYIQWCWFSVCKLHNDSQLKHELLPVYIHGADLVCASFRTTHNWNRVIACLHSMVLIWCVQASERLTTKQGEAARPKSAAANVNLYKLVTQWHTFSMAAKCFPWPLSPQWPCGKGQRAGDTGVRPCPPKSSHHHHHSHCLWPLLKLPCWSSG